MRLLRWWGLATVMVAILQFVAWAMADAMGPGVGGSLLWSVFSIPIFLLLPARAATQFFWPALMANSAVWGLLIVVGISRVWTRRPEGEQGPKMRR